MNRLDELIASLRQGEWWKTVVQGPNPTGFTTDETPTIREAADELARLRDALDEKTRDASFIWKWVERAIFDKQIGTNEALDTLAHYPGAPWKRGRWDVDHKPYAKAFYAKFPKATATKIEKDAQ